MIAQLKQRLEALHRDHKRAVDSMNACKGGFSPKDSIDRAIAITCLNARIDEVRTLYMGAMERESRSAEGGKTSKKYLTAYRKVLQRSLEQLDDLYEGEMDNSPTKVDDTIRGVLKAVNHLRGAIATLLQRAES